MEQYGTCWYHFWSSISLSASERVLKKQTVENSDNIHDEDIGANRFAIVLIIMAFAIYVKYPRYSGNMNNDGNGDILPYVEYPGSPTPPIYCFCLSPGQSFPMTVEY